MTTLALGLCAAALIISLIALILSYKAYRAIGENYIKNHKGEKIYKTLGVFLLFSVGAFAQTPIMEGSQYIGKTTTAIGNISSPLEGRLEYNTTLGKFVYWNGSTWLETGGGTIQWGDIGGTLSNQTDLQTALDGKLPSSGSVVLPGDLTISGNVRPLLLRGSGSGVSNRTYIAYQHSDGSNMFSIGDISVGENDLSIMNHLSGKGLFLRGNGSLMYGNDEVLTDASDLTGMTGLPDASDFVDLTSNQSIAGDKTFSGTSVFSGTVNATGTLNTTGTLNAQSGDVLLPGNLTDSYTQTVITGGSDPTGSSTIMFNTSGVLRPLTATATDITYDGQSLLAGGGGTAASTTLTPFGTIGSTNVQDGLEELESETYTAISGNNGDITALATRVDDIETALNTVPSSAFDFDTKTADYTAVAGDAADNKIILLNFDDEDFTIPSGVFDEGQAIRLQSIAATTANIVPGSGVSFDGKDGFVLDSVYKSITLARISSATGPEEWMPIDGYIKEYAALGPELVTNGSFDTDTDWSKLNGTTISGGVANVIANGSIASTGANHVLEQSIWSGDSGKTFKVTFDARQTVGSGNLNVGTDFYRVFNEAVTGTFATYTFTFEMNANTNITFGGSTASDEFEIDNVSVREVLAP